MEFFQTTQLAVPLIQIMLLLALSTVTLLIGKVRLALLMNYLFAFYWGYVFNADLFNSLDDMRDLILIDDSEYCFVTRSAFLHQVPETGEDWDIMGENTPHTDAVDNSSTGDVKFKEEFQNFIKMLLLV